MREEDHICVMAYHSPSPRDVVAKNSGTDGIDGLVVQVREVVIPG